MPALTDKPTSLVQIMVDIMTAIRTGISDLVPNESASFTVGANFETTVLGDLAPDTTAFHICQRDGSDIGSAVAFGARQVPLLLNIALQGDGEKEENEIVITDGLATMENLIFKARELISETYVGQDTTQFSYYLDASESPTVRAEVEITLSV